jgi:hypothetical protein
MSGPSKRYVKGEIFMKMWRFGALLFLCIVLVCTFALAEDSVSGVWQGTDEKTGAILRLTLMEDGNFEAFRTDRQEVYAGAYEAKDGICTLMAQGGGPFEFKYIQSDGSLILLTKKGKVYTFQKQDGLLLDKAIIGTWGGMDNGMYKEITFTPAGEAFVFIPYQDTGLPATTYSTAGDKLLLRDEFQKASLIAYEAAAVKLTLKYEDGRIISLMRKQGPLERTRHDGEPVTAGADSMLCGTWGIYGDGMYREITFSADGSYVSYIPQERDIKYYGKYIAWNGTVVILIRGGLHVDAYQIKGDELWYTPAGQLQQVFERRIGELNRK